MQWKPRWKRFIGLGLIVVLFGFIASLSQERLPIILSLIAAVLYVVAFILFYVLAKKSK